MRVDAAPVSHSSRSFGTTDPTNETRKPMLPSEVSNVSSRNDGWSTGTKVALGVTGTVIAVGTVLTAVGSGNPGAGLVAAGGLLASLSRPFSSSVAVPETLPSPDHLVDDSAQPTSPVDACNLLVATASAWSGQRIADISLAQLKSVKGQVNELSVADLGSLNSGQLNQLGKCSGRNLMAYKVSPLKARLEDAKKSVMEGRADTLIGQVSDSIFHSSGVVRKNLLLAEINPRLRVVSEIHAKIRTFVLAINDRILSNTG